MMNIFEVFLPQLLRYPNAADPLNGDAAALQMRDPAAYEAKVKGTLPFPSILHSLTEVPTSRRLRQTVCIQLYTIGQRGGEDVRRKGNS